MRIAFAAFALTTASTLAAQTPATQSAGATAGVPSATAVRAAQPPAIDGQENDAVWRTAPEVDAFLQFLPKEGAPPRYRTTFKAAYDDRNLYVFVRAYDPHPDSIMTALTRRDVRGPSDQLKVMIDSYHDRRSGFEFAVNPVGVKRDYAMYNDKDEDQSWDGVWDVGTRVDSVGWTAEFRIPFSQLRYASAREHVFGFSVWRDLERYKERMSWPLFRNSQSGISSQLGELHGIVDIAPFRRFELVPYVVGKSVTVARGGPVAGVPVWGTSQKSSFGGDVKFGLTPNLTVDATVNPDFGQVEADPAVLNLSAFETFFDEKRPFFLEGSGLYRYDMNCNIVNCGGEGLFYSRRIGRSPQLLGNYGDATSPNVTPIVGAAKVTGRLSDGLNLGVLEAVTGHVEGTADRTTEPRASYTVARLQQDLRGGETSIGAIVTSVNRAQDEWTADLLRRDAFAGGVNVRHRWGRSRYELAGSVSGTDVRGSRQAIFLTQTSSVHLYQRPDDALRVDSAATSLAGDAEELSLSKMGGGLVKWQTSAIRLSPGLEPNDLGYLRRANQLSTSNWMGLQWIKPTHLYRQLSGNFNAWAYWTSAGMLTDQFLNSNWHMNLANNMWLNASATLQHLGGYCDDCARGGPAVRRAPYAGYSFTWQGDDRRVAYPTVSIFDGNGVDGHSHDVEISPQVELRPLSQLQFTLGLDWDRNDNHVQWLGNFDDATATHYAFAHLKQETRSASVRVSYAATPTLTVQLYAQPFVSRGQFSDVRELSATPRAERFDDRYVAYTPPADTPLGFDAMQMRSNSVLRWEFRPGSTMYVVWSHGRDGYDPAFSGRGWKDEYDNLFALHPDNTFLVKLAYWLD